MTEFFSKKQANFIRALKKNELRRINILEGAVRTGKTWISLVAWALWVATMPQNAKYLMVAKTVTSLERNCLDLLKTLVGEKNFRYSTSSKRGVLFGRTIYLEGVNDARAESKIRGMTLQGAYCDELTLFTEDFFTMLLSRLSLPGAKLFGTTNPDSPGHWLYTKYLKRGEGLDLYQEKFLIDDNPHLDPEYVANLKREYTGVFYQRYILGEWVIAEGLVYDFGEDNITDDIPTGAEYYVSIDYGTQNPFSAGLWSVTGGKATRIKEYYYSGRESSVQKTDEEYCDEIVKLTEDFNIKSVVVDPSAASFIAALRKRGYHVRKANNDVVDGIRATASMLKNKDIMIHRSCADAIREFGVYAWDDKSSVDKVIKENDHAMDDIRYFCYTIMKHKVNKAVYRSLWAAQ